MHTLHMTKKLDTTETGSSLGDKRRTRAYLKEFGPAMILYVVAIFGTSALGTDTTAKKVIFLAATTVPLLLATVAVVRQVGRSDEYQRLIAYRSMAIAFAVTMVTSVFIALITSAGFTVNPRLTSWVPFLVGMFTWGALGCFGSKRQ
jgi:hypothetical protein